LKGSHFQLLLVAVIAIYAGTYYVLRGLSLIRTHDFTATKIKDGIDPGKSAEAAKYFGVLLCAMGAIFYSVLLLWVLPKSQWRALSVPPMLWGVAFFYGSLRYARPKSRNAKRDRHPPAP
jgi:hypothetical protein